MSVTPISVPPILRIIKDSFKGDLGKKSVYLGDAAIAMSLATIARGNWQPMEKTRTPVKTHLLTLPDMDSADHRAAKAAVTATHLVTVLTSQEGISAFLEAQRKPEVEPTAIVTTIEGLVRGLIQSIVELYLTFESTATASFSETLRLRCVQFCGEWHVSLSDVLTGAEDPDTFTKMCIDTLQHAADASVRRDQLVVQTACTILFQFYQKFKTEYASAKA